MRAEQIVEFLKEFFLRQAQLTKQRIKEDALVGIGQDNNILQGPYSPQYARYKANWMQRFTTRKYKKGTKHLPAGTIARKGTKIKAYKGVSIKSNETKIVNMYLTGQLLDGITVTKADSRGFTLSFLGNKSTEKLLGNELRGRVIAWISDENVDLIIADMNKMIDDNITRFEAEDVIIKVE